MVALWVLQRGLVDEVHLCPTANHPFGKNLTPFDTRMAMCEALAHDLGVPDIKVNDIENRMDSEVSYTYLTLQQFRAENPDAIIRPIMGADILGETHKWKMWGELDLEFDPIFQGREGYPPPPVAPHEQFTVPNFSSTEIRRMVSEGGDLTGKLTHSVMEYVLARGLYT